MKKRGILLLFIAGGMMLWAGNSGEKGSAPASGEKKEEKPVPAFEGNAKCKMCHKIQFESWSKTRMANAMESLKPGTYAEEKKKVGLDPQKDYTTDPNCLSCHTTGYKQPGGFTDMEKTKLLAGVSCEACHGPSSLWIKSHMSKKDHKIADLIPLGFRYPGTEKDCETCHNEKSPFNEKVDKKYQLKYDKDTLSKSVHQHELLKHDHGEIKGALFQVKEKKEESKK